MKSKWIVALAVVVLASAVAANMASARNDFHWDTPKLPAGTAVTIDGDPSEWMDFAWSDGVWDWERVAASSWYGPEGVSKPPAATGPDEGAEAGTPDDFSVETFAAWDDDAVYFAFVVTDNIWDVHSVGESNSFANSDVACIVIDAKGGFGRTTEESGYRNAGIASWWWRAGEGSTDGTADDLKRRISHTVGETAQYFGEDVPEAQGRTIVDPVGTSPNALGGSWVFEGKLTWQGIIDNTEETWAPPFEGREMGWIFFAIDADGAQGDSFFFLYGGAPTSDAENYSWTTFVLGEDVAVETTSWGQVKQLFK